MKKAAIVVYALNVGGMESVLISLARGLRGCGIGASFIVTDSVGAWHGRICHEGFSVQSILPSPWESRRSHVRRLAAAMKGVDVVLLNHSRAGQSAAGLLSDVPAIISVLHNNDEDIYNVGLANQANIDAIVAVGDRVLQEAKKRGAAPSKLVRIRNGVEVFPVFPKGGGDAFSSGPLKILFLGRIVHRQKGVFYLPQILAAVRAARISVRLDIVGDGPDLGQLLRLLKEKKVADAATVHGFLSHDRAMDLLSGSDVLIMPSHYEGQPITLFEGMARGVVPVVSRMEGITDTVIEDGVTGFLPPAGDEDAFASSLVRLSDEEFRRKVSVAVWKAAAVNFSMDSMTRSYVDLICQCMENRKRGRLPARTQKVDLTVLGRYSQFPAVVQGLGRKLKKSLERNGNGNRY